MKRHITSHLQLVNQIVQTNLQSVEYPNVDYKIEFSQTSLAAITQCFKNRRLVIKIIVKFQIFNNMNLVLIIHAVKKSVFVNRETFSIIHSIVRSPCSFGLAVM